jgi:hypothetical protein
MRAASMAIDCMNLEAKIALEITGTKCPQSMTADERRAAYGPQASIEGAVDSTKSTSIPVGYAGANMNDPFIAARAESQQ